MRLSSDLSFEGRHNTYDSAYTMTINALSVEDLVQGDETEPKFLMISGHRGHADAAEAMSRAGKAMAPDATGADAKDNLLRLVYETTAPKSERSKDGSMKAATCLEIEMGYLTAFMQRRCSTVTCHYCYIIICHPSPQPNPEAPDPDYMCPGV